MKEKIILGIFYLSILTLFFNSIVNAYTLPNNAECNPELGSITSISTSSFAPGATVQLQGTGFSTRDLTDQVTESITLVDQANTVVEITGINIISWTDTQIDFTIPADLVLSSGYLAVKINSAENSTQYICTPELEASAWSLTESAPESQEAPIDLTPTINSFSPNPIYPSAKVTITGENLREADDWSCSQCIIKINNNTLYPSQDENWHYEWSNTTISFKVPWYELQEPIDSIKIITNKGVESNSLPISIVPNPNDPLITSVSPEIIIPGETIVTLTGERLGEGKDNQDRVCLGGCVWNNFPGESLIKWTDTQIEFRAPYEILGGQQKTSIYTFIPSRNSFGLVYGPDIIAKQIPKIGLSYYDMKQGSTYNWGGYFFGSTPGKVILNGIELKIESWNDTDIFFKIPDDAESGELYIESSEGLKSKKMTVKIIEVKKYSNDEFSYLQYYLEQLGFDKAWEITEGSSDVVVAVIDTGVDINHDDLRDALWINQHEIAANGLDDDANGYIDDIFGWNFASRSNSMEIKHGHGTMVASVIASQKDNQIGISGAAPGIKIMALNINATEDGALDLDGANKAIKYAVDNGADIINLSFGGYNSGMFYEQSLKYAYQNNVLVVAAAHNHNKDLDENVLAPACTDLNYNAVLGIASVGRENLKSDFSNYGSNCVDLVAPGEDILVAIAGTDDFYSSYGTSFSTPLVASIAALVKSKNPDWNIEEIKKVILDSATNVDSLNPTYAGQLGRGLPNAYLAVTASRPTVVYDKFNPDTELVIKDTGIKVKIQEPITEPIKEPEPIKVPEPVKIEIKEELVKTTFPDVVGHKNENAINYLRKIGVINGYPDGTFKPENDVNRAELLKIIIEGKGLTPQPSEYNNCFSDIKDEWFAPYVCYAQIKGWVQGYPDGTFKPEQTVNKVESVKMLLKSREVPVKDFIVNKAFEDIDINEWYAPYIATAAQLEILEEKENTFFNPADGMKRAGVSEILYRLLMTDY